MRIGKLVRIICIMIIILGILGVVGSNQNNNEKNELSIKVGTLTGPTAFGMSKLFENEKYEIIVCASPDEIVAKIVNNELDIAALPTNSASMMYNKTSGKVKILAVNTLGNLYVITNRNDINKLDELDGKRILLAGKGATPEVVATEITKDMNTTLDFRSEHAEVVSLLKANKGDTAILPEPFVSIALNTLTDYRVAINLSQVWKNEKNKELPMGCVVVDRDFASNKDIVKQFLNDYAESINYTLENTKEATKIIVDNNIFANELVVENAIPRCNITIMTGEEMKQSVSEYLNLINNFNPLMIGGSIPDEEFYY